MSILAAPIATLSDAEGKIIAFTTFMPVYQDGSLSVDLMRYYPDAPSGIMDAIFIHLFHWAKENDYHSFNIGMAPLSNVGLSTQSFWSERVVAPSLIMFVIRIVSADYDILKKNISQHGAVNI